MRALGRVSILATAAALGALALPAGAGEAAKPKEAARETVATVLRLSGTVEFRRSGREEFAALVLASKLYAQDEVKTGGKSAVELKLADGARLTLGAESSLVIRAVRTKAQPDATLLDLDGGALGVTVDQPLAGRQRFEVSTPVAVCGVRGTRFATRHRNPRRGRRAGDRGKTRVTVSGGKVVAKCLNPFFAGKPGMVLGRNQSVEISWDGFDAPQPGRTTKRNLKRLMGSLPGWVPDPADPNLVNPLADDGGGGGRLSIWRAIGGRPRGGGTRGLPGGDTYSPTGSGLTRAVGRAILSDVGLLGGTPMSRSLGGNSPGGTGGDDPGANPTGDPVDTNPVRPGQPLEPPPPPPPPPQEPPVTAP
jgi:hypothetical protein